MANNKSNVSAGKPKIGGAVYRAPKGTTAPTSADATLADSFKAMGYISSDGLTNANNATTSNIKAWGGDTVLVVQTDKVDTLAFTLLEVLNTDVLAAVHGSGNVSGALATGIVSMTLILSGIKVDETTAAAIDPQGQLILKVAMFAIPLLMIIAGYIVYLKKYRITEEYYAEMLRDLEAREAA